MIKIGILIFILFYSGSMIYEYRMNIMFLFIILD